MTSVASGQKHCRPARLSVQGLISGILAYSLGLNQRRSKGLSVGVLNPYESRAMSETDLSEWWMAVTQQEFRANCLTQLAYAWVGAIYQVRQTLQEPVESFDVVKGFLEFNQCCLWPEEWNSASLRERMGIAE